MHHMAASLYFIKKCSTQKLLRQESVFSLLYYFLLKLFKACVRFLNPLMLMIRIQRFRQTWVRRCRIRASNAWRIRKTAEV